MVLKLTREERKCLVMIAKQRETSLASIFHDYLTRCSATLKHRNSNTISKAVQIHDAAASS